MEIISYVQDKPRSRKFNRINRINLSNFQTKLNTKQKRNNTVTYLPFTPELRTFVPQKVRQPVSIRTFFRMVGYGIRKTGDFISSNILKIIACIIVFAAASSSVYFGTRFISYKVNFTGPLQLENLYIDSLNQLMSEFALENSENVDEEGNILDASVTTQAFTQPVSYQTYKVQSGDTISGIAKKFGINNISTLISVNDIGNVRQLAAGQKLKIPSIDGILYTVKKGDSIASITSKYNCKVSALLDVNDLTSETLTAGQQLFLPGVGLDANTLKNALGNVWMMPIQAQFRWTSPYGNRIDPIAGVKSFHTGTDMACPTGTPILATMSGKVTAAGVNRVYGNYVIIDHGNGYQTLYGHMSKIIATKGQWVSQGTRIGLVGSTGYSTGPHLHFTVYKNGKLVDPMSVLKK